VVRVKPRNVNGWSELLKCLYTTGCFEEGAEYVQHALEMTGFKPIFYFYQSAFMLALGKTKDAASKLHLAMTKNPKLLKKLLELSPSILQHQAMVDVIAAYKRNKSI